MSHFDVFNGDADGICALQQLRLAQPREAALVTGLKRDIALLARVRAQAGDSVTVLDVSLDRNRAALLDLLARGVEVRYFDHHFAGALPRHPLLRAVIDTAPDVCTSLLVDRALVGAHRAWAVAGAFGDNLAAVAEPLGRSAGLDDEALRRLRALGEAMNYNAYGDDESDLLVPPARLYTTLRPYADPLEFAAREPLVAALVARRREDLAQAEALASVQPRPGGTLYRLPDAPWARRVQGSFANALSQRVPDRAHAVLRETAGDAFVVNVRAPRGAAAGGADTLCRRFPTGGGRAAAAGIDRLPRERERDFLAAFDAAYPGGG